MVFLLGFILANITFIFICWLEIDIYLCEICKSSTKIYKILWRSESKFTSSENVLLVCTECYKECKK